MVTDQGVAERSTPRGIVPPRPNGDIVAKLTSKADRSLARRKPSAPSDLDLFQVGYGQISSTSSAGWNQTHSTSMCKCDDWEHLGVLISRSRTVRGWHVGYLRAVIGTRIYEAFADTSVEGITTLLMNGNVLGWWRAADFSYDGRFAAPLVRELYDQASHRIGILDSANLGGGCAVLELDPDGAMLIPIRIKSAGVIAGNPWREVAKLTPFGRSMGPRSPNLDTVLTRQAGILRDAELELFFAASLALRGMECVKISSD
jgi:hypothetical protein